MIPQKLRNLAYLYISLPLFIFLANWLSPLFAIVFTVLYLTEVILLCRNKNKNVVQKPIKHIIPCLIVGFVWAIWSGIGGYVFQSLDFHVRNMIFHDLIEYQWPVFYTPHLALNYYFGFWLPSALLTKLFGLFFDSEIVFRIGLNLLLFYSFLGLSLFFLILANCLPKGKKSKWYLALIIPIFFSGMDIVMNYSHIFPLKLDPYRYHIEWWTNEQYSGMTSCLFWVFNQSIIPWLCTLLFFFERDIKHFGFYFLICFFIAPFPSVGLLILMGLYTLFLGLKSYKEHHFLSFFSQLINCRNYICIPIILLIALFYMANTNINDSAPVWTNWSLKNYGLFILLEFLLYCVVLFPSYKKDPLFYGVILSLLFICLVHYGVYGDFAMRSSIPALLLLCVFVTQRMVNTPFKNNIILIVFLIIGSATSITEMARGPISMIKTGQFVHIIDGFKSISKNKITEFPFYQYVTKDPKKQIFFACFSKLPEHTYSLSLKNKRRIDNLKQRKGLR